MHARNVSWVFRISLGRTVIESERKAVTVTGYYSASLASEEIPAESRETTGGARAFNWLI
jgi:hypothetical protein